MSRQAFDNILEEYFQQSYVVADENSGRVGGGYKVYVPLREYAARYEGDPIRCIEVSNDPDAHITIVTSDDGCAYFSVRPDYVVANLEIYLLVKLV